MSHFSRIRVSGFWTLGSTLLPDEVEVIDACLSKAINGDEGGVWAPTAVIEIGGLGLKMTGPFRVTSTGSCRVDVLGDFRLGLSVQGGDLSCADNLAVQGNITGLGTLHADGLITSDTGVSTHGSVSADDNVMAGGNGSFDGTLHAGGQIDSDGNILAGGNLQCLGALDVGTNATIAGYCAVTGNLSGHNIGASGTLMAVGNTSLGGTLSVSGATTLSSTLGVTGNTSLGGTLICTGVARFNGGIYLPTGAAGRFDGDSTLDGNLKIQNAGHLTYRRIDGSTTSATYGIADADEITAPPSLPGDITYTLSTTGAQSGDRMRFVVPNTFSGHTVTVDGFRDGGHLDLSFGTIRALDATFDGTGWYISMISKL